MKVYTKVTNDLKKTAMYWTIEDLEFLRDIHRNTWNEPAEADVLQTLVDRIKKANGTSINIYTGEIA